MITRAIDNLIGVFSPAWALRREMSRFQRTTFSDMLGGGNSKGGYQAAKINRLTRGQQTARQNENSIDRGEIARLRVASWDLYRNNPQAKKIIRSLEAKVIGRGLDPQSQATDEKGNAHVEFRKRAIALWKAVGKQVDYRGKPGAGGQSMVELCKSALRNTVLGGEVLARCRLPSDATTPAGRDRFFIPPPLKLQLIHADRIDETVNIPGSPRTFYGIALDTDERRTGYWILDHHPSDSYATQASTFIAASEVTHLYIGEDIDQLRGVPWFSAALLKMRDTGDYEFNELKAAAMAACVVFAYGLSAGQTGFMPPLGDEWGGPTDSEGNAVTQFQPGMVINKGTNGSIEMLNPQRPNANAEAFIAHMLRSQATAVPGIKGSTLTGDYRNSSFSSERAADNDTWPELESIQDWFASDFCQPLYERIVTAGIASGWFDGVVSPEEFAARRGEFLTANWQGPVARSINPIHDATASRMRVQNGTSSPQIEAALTGRNWQEVAMQVAEYIQFCETQKLPASVVAQALGIDQQDNPLSDPEFTDSATNPDQPNGDKSKEGATQDATA